MVKSSENSNFEVLVISRGRVLAELQTKEGVFLVAENGISFVIKVRTKLDGLYSARLFINDTIIHHGKNFRRVGTFEGIKKSLDTYAEFIFKTP